MTSYLRPDEELRDQKKRSSETISGLLKTGASAAAGTAIASRVAPFLSKYLPIALAIKGISKVSPKLGNFLNEGQRMGLDVKEGLDFIKEKMEPAKQDLEKKSPTQPNLIGQVSPELQSFIEQGIQAGKSPDHAAALAMPRAEFAQIIKGIEKQSKKKFTELVRELYEGKAVEQPESKAALQGQPGMDQQQNQGLDPGVAQILQQGQALLSKFKGG